MMKDWIKRNYMWLEEFSCIGTFFWFVPFALGLTILMGIDWSFIPYKLLSMVMIILFLIHFILFALVSENIIWRWVR